jgi:hypothetical protein
MRCRDARQWLLNQGSEEEAPQQKQLVLEHLARCPACQTYRRQQQQVGRLLQQSSPAPVPCNLSTEQIMQAIYLRQRTTRQLEQLRLQERSRLARLRPLGSSLLIVLLLLTASLPVVLFVLFFIEPEVLVSLLPVLGGVVDVLLIAAQYLLLGLSIVSQDNLLLAALAFVLLLLAGIWLRLMRVPQEA